jgi:glycosyltransferase involved in cell wall biosynthesis
MIPIGQGRMTPLSIYVLTFNSEKYLSAILQAVAPLADDLLVVDSGSSDQTVAIATQCGARVLYRRLMIFASSVILPSNNAGMITCFLDSDEIPSPSWWLTSSNSSRAASSMMPMQSSVTGL